MGLTGLPCNLKLLIQRAQLQMKIPEITLSAENGRSIQLNMVNETCPLGRRLIRESLGIPDPTISNDHCQIRWRGRNFWIRDGTADGINSLTGTEMDGLPLPFGQWLPLPRKARLLLGQTRLSTHYEETYSKEYDLMISYSRKDEVAVLALHREILNLGLRPWLDQKSHQPATHYKREIEKVILEVRSVVVFWGGKGMGDTHAAEVEVVTDLHIHKRIQSLFLVVLPGSEDPNWGLFLNNIDYYDLRKAGEHQRLMDDLARQILCGEDQSPEG